MLCGKEAVTMQSSVLVPGAGVWRGWESWKLEQLSVSCTVSCHEPRPPGHLARHHTHHIPTLCYILTCYMLHVTCDDWARCSDCYHITTELLTGEMCRTDNCCWSWLIVMDHVRISRLGTQTGNIPSSGSQRRPGGDRRVQFADKI